MSAVWRVFWLIWQDQRGAFLRGGALSMAVLLAGVALLGVSGWFITAAAAAGLAGAGAVFDVFRPSALIRFLALGRSFARYGERVFSHDATLRGFASLRLRLLRGFAQAPYDRLMALRGAQAVNRVSADIEALDGVALRFIVPLLAGAAAQVLAFAVLWALLGLPIAAMLAVGYLGGGGAVLIWAARAGLVPSRRAELAAQAFRSRLMDLLQARGDLAVYGQLDMQHQHVIAADQRCYSARLCQDRIERRAGFWLSCLGSGLASAALGLGIQLAQSGHFSPALAATGFFAALALQETVAPLRRAVAEFGRMALAARQVLAGLAAVPQGEAVASAGRLQMHEVSYQRPGADRVSLRPLSFSLHPGQIIALAGPSGCGKSTALALAAGLLHPSAGRVQRPPLTLVPQRSALMAGSIRAALRLADPDADDASLWAVLQAVALTDTIRAKGGLAYQLGPRGAGLSGGEARRLCLARALLRRPAVLLLDEPTEGLDAATAALVLAGIRQHLPQAAILTASHRPAELDWADKVVWLP